ncbi:hypothetical protein BO94DRAFT_616130 [Aspergillus sclerotioniger CBS 115572]|uniref:Uncharacterized protein n=1 Tax=Aspergillus sclerotioniger CBS 115572 TaxID=1450535 RepID=A0A317X4U7_9EURO|nr:hypothetical protein BO94DRAFT_616130 [Aspergillus sclerotioniger CBS 115572]PWY93221.1 hypothetical protein BO94DRAFT_616130 [Aspergillus sclerotioniger CBS 115572]
MGPKDENMRREWEFGSKHRRIEDRKALRTRMFPQLPQPWRSQYLTEEKVGFAILQRQHRLVSILNETKDHDGLEGRPTYDGNPSELERELKKLDEEYWKHQIRLGEVADQSPDSPSVDEIYLLRSSADRYNRSFAWVKGRQACTDLGGYCGRSCGCCERVLRQYTRPSEKADTPEGVIVEVRGHCTVECACCIQHRGCYLPHPRLPPTEVSPEIIV